MCTYLGIEFGSTKIKAVQIGEDYQIRSAGDYSWKSDYCNGIWTYDLQEAWLGVQTALKAIKEPESIRCIGVSGMMHGYLAFDKDWKLLVPFRTWQNTTTTEAAEQLSNLFGFNIPQRWSVAHLYQAILDHEKHVENIAHITTLAGYIHYRLTGINAVGIGEASGMFPVDGQGFCYDRKLLDLFGEVTKDQTWNMEDLLPAILAPGADAGYLTEEGAKRIDAAGRIPVGIPLCPPEGDASTGMVATNAIGARTGNISAGTSAFAMIVLEKPLQNVYREIDMVATPEGRPVAMVHCNNCTNEINAWAEMFGGFLESIGEKADMDAIYTAMFKSAMQGQQDAGGLLVYNCLAGEPMISMPEGRPLLVRTPLSSFNFANLMRAHLFSALASLRLGMDILRKENVEVDRLLAHGGFFKTPLVGQQMVAAATGIPVSVMKTAGEGGPWGMALLAAYRMQKQSGQSLENYLREKVFSGQVEHCVAPEAVVANGFCLFMQRYKQGLPILQNALHNLD